MTSESAKPRDDGNTAGKTGKTNETGKPDPRGPLPGKPDQDPGTVRQSTGGEPLPRLPHERDESHQSQQTGSRPVGRQAASDIERGLEETDLYGSRGRRGGASADETND